VGVVRSPFGRNVRRVQRRLQYREHRGIETPLGIMRIFPSISTTWRAAAERHSAKDPTGVLVHVTVVVVGSMF
jgi:hypothetical protein